MTSDRDTPVTATTRVSCVMCTVDRHDLIARAVASVLAGDHESVELIVVDQSTNDLTRQACEPFSRDPRFRYVHSNRRGLSAAYNLSIAQASYDIIAFTDDDCVAHSDWVHEVVGIFDANPDIDMLYGQTLAPADHHERDGVVPVLHFAESRLIGRGHGLAIIGMGANFAIRRRLIDRIGGFDEALGGGGPLRSSQDFDFHYRAYRAGAIIRLSPELKVDHYGVRRRGDQWTKTLEAYGIGDGAFYWKHVRCGDLTALRLLLQRIVKLSVREILNPIRHRSSSLPYLKACAVGMRKSMEFKVNRARRVYIMPEGAA